MTRLVCFSCAATERDGAEFPDVAWVGDERLAVMAARDRLCLDCMREAVREYERTPSADRRSRPDLADRENLQLKGRQ